MSTERAIITALRFHPINTVKNAPSILNVIHNCTFFTQKDQNSASNRAPWCSSSASPPQRSTVNKADGQNNSVALRDLFLIDPTVVRQQKAAQSTGCAAFHPPGALP
jgi:alkyl hydroperoxide reductase subunit AhpC